MPDLFVVISRPLDDGPHPGSEPFGPADHYHRTPEAARKCCIPGTPWRFYDICRVAGDLRPVVETIGPPLVTTRSGEVDGIHWTWTRFERGHPTRAYWTEARFERGDWVQEYEAPPNRKQVDGGVRLSRNSWLTAERVEGAAWMLSLVAMRDVTSAAVLVRALQRPIEAEVEGDEGATEPAREGRVIAGPWTPKGRADA